MSQSLYPPLNPQPVSGTVAATQSGTWNVGTVTTVTTVSAVTAITNTVTVTGAGGTFPITDSGGSITVDNAGTFAVQAAQNGTWTVQPGNTANTTAWLVTGTGGVFPVTDNSGSLTVDAPVGTPVFVRLSDGTAALATLPVSIAGTVAVDSELTTADLDTGAGTDTRAVVGLVYAASGGAQVVSVANALPVSVQGFASVTVTNASLTVDADHDIIKGTALTLAARTAQATATLVKPRGYIGIMLFIRVTVVGTGTITPFIQGVDPVSGTAGTMWNATAITAVTGVYQAIVYPNVAAAPAGTALTPAGTVGLPCPEDLVVGLAKSDGSSWTCGLGYCWLK